MKVELPDAELDTAYEEARKNITGETFQQELKRRGLTAADMREGLRRELLSQKVIEHEVSSKVGVSDQEVDDYFNANKARFNFPEEAYHIAQIIVTPAPDAQPANQAGDDATTPQAAAAKVQMHYGAPQGRRVLWRSWREATPKIRSRRPAAATWVSCRSRGCRKRRRRSAMPC